MAYDQWQRGEGLREVNFPLAQELVYLLSMRTDPVYQNDNLLDSLPPTPKR
jgi:hypothetical protein